MAESQFPSAPTETLRGDAARAAAAKGPVHSLDIRCEFCPGQSFRRSRLRTRDFKELLRFRYPVRCLTCSQRQLVGFTVAGLSHSSYVKHHHGGSNVSKEWLRATASGSASGNSGLGAREGSRSDGPAT